MNKSELSIGDWVKVPKLVYDCGLEDFDNGMCKVRRLRYLDLDVYAYEDLDYSEVEPILITNTILSALGFVEKDPVKEPNTFELRTDDLLVTYSTTLETVDILKSKEKIQEPDKIEQVSANKIKFYLSADILYLHQLQHLLRLVGIELNESVDVKLMGIYEL